MRSLTSWSDSAWINMLIISVPRRMRQRSNYIEEEPEFTEFPKISSHKLVNSEKFLLLNQTQILVNASKKTF